MNKQADQKTLVKFFGPIKVEKVQASRGKTLGNLTYFIATYPDGYKDFDTELEAVEWAKKKAPSIQRFLDGYVARGASTMKKQTAMIHRELIGVFGPIKVEKVSGVFNSFCYFF